MQNTSIATTAALIVAAGTGSRAAGSLAGPPKQYLPIAGQPVLSYSLDAFLAHPMIGSIQVVIGARHMEQYRRLAPDNPKLRPPVTGAATRQASVMAGLEAFRDRAPERVLIHDGARPFVSPQLISRVAKALDEAEAVVPTLPVTSTLKSVDVNATITGTVSRVGLHTAETPQGFRFGSILGAHIKAAAEGLMFTDDAAIAEWIGVPVSSVPGESDNVKLTTAADIANAERRLICEETLRLGEVRVGTGYDVHPMGAGDRIILGGITIPHTGSLVGHSDADVVLHALTDALLGALADGDIGVHFPPSDPRWKGASSDLFLEDAVRRVTERGGGVANLDVTVIAEAPKIGPYRDAMRRRITEISGLDIDRISVKATTHERLGFVGRGEGIAAYATATIRLPLDRPR